MRSMFSGLLARNTADKIVAVCAGLAVCLAVLLVVDMSGTAARLPGVLLDDRVLGRRVEPAWAFFAAEFGAMVALLLLLHRRPGTASALGIGWSLLMLAETIADVGTYRGNAYFAGEEGAFALIYLYLLGLFIVYGCGRLERQGAEACQTQQPWSNVSRLSNARSVNCKTDWT